MLLPPPPTPHLLLPPPPTPHLLLPPLPPPPTPHLPLLPPPPPTPPAAASRTPPSPPAAASSPQSCSCPPRRMTEAAPAQTPPRTWRHQQHPRQPRVRAQAGEAQGRVQVSMPASELRWVRTQAPQPTSCCCWGWRGRVLGGRCVWARAGWWRWTGGPRGRRGGPRAAPGGRPPPLRPPPL